MWKENRVYIGLSVVILLILLQTWHSVSPIPLQININYPDLYKSSKDISVIPIHSHNDEWRSRPFLDGYQAGSKSVELDVWAFDSKPGRLYVGHNRNYLDPSLNLKAVYLDRIYGLLEQANPDSTTANGVFYDDPHLSLYLYIDVKPSNGTILLDYLTVLLEPFLQKDWVTFYSDELNWRPLTIVITGNYPLEYITSMEKRFYFVDAPLLDVAKDDFKELYKPGEISLTTSLSLLKLCDLKSTLVSSGSSKISMKGLNTDQLSKIDDYLRLNNELGLVSRIWETPNWPIRKRNQVWLQLLELGVGLLNVDDLKNVVKFF